MTWLAVHLYYLIGFQNRFVVVSRWAVSYFTQGRGARLIISQTNARAVSQAPVPIRSVRSSAGEH